MKRSKIFLSVSTFILAGVAFAAAKAHRVGAQVYYTVNSACTHITNPAQCVTFGTSGTHANVCTAGTGTLPVKTLYTTCSNGNFGRILYTSGSANGTHE